MTVAEVLPLVERHLSELLAWAPYDADAGLRAAPEPGARVPADLRDPVLSSLTRRVLLGPPSSCAEGCVGSR